MAYSLVGNILADAETGKTLSLFCCDSSGDVSSIPTESLLPLSVAFIPSTQTKKVLDNSGTWR